MTTLNKLVLSEEIAAEHGSALRSISPDIKLVLAQPDGSYDGDPSDAQAFYFSLDLAETDGALGAAVSLLRSEALRWVQSPGAGFDLPIWTDLLQRGVRLTNASGIHAEPIAQYIFTYILHWHRHVAEHQRLQRDAKWERIVSDDLTDKTLGIVGYGGIGEATARVAKAFGMHVVASRRRPIDDPAVDIGFRPDQLGELLGQSDYVVLCLPLNDDTRHTIGAVELAAMKSDAVLINVARGGVVDQPTLVEALSKKQIRGATLDVVEPEPLNADSPLWSLDNCIITPHNAGFSPAGPRRLSALFLDNFERYVAGRELRNEVQLEDT